jgi:CheY-like chemotaxis protein
MMQCCMTAVCDADLRYAFCVGFNISDASVAVTAYPGKLDGIDLARELRRRHPDLPVLLVSGYAIAPERLAGLDIGMLAKPYTHEGLRQAMARLLPASREYALQGVSG